jgi:hypothetical protein
MSSIILGDCSCGPCGGLFFKIRQVAILPGRLPGETLADSVAAGSAQAAAIHAANPITTLPWGVAPNPGPGLGGGGDWFTLLQYTRDPVTGAWGSALTQGPIPAWYSGTGSPIFQSNTLATNGASYVAGYSAGWSQVWTNCDVWFWMSDQNGLSVCSGGSLGYDCVPSGGVDSLYTFDLPAEFDDLDPLGTQVPAIYYAMCALQQGGADMTSPCTGALPAAC